MENDREICRVKSVVEAENRCQTWWVVESVKQLCNVFLFSFAYSHIFTTDTNSRCN